MIKLQLLLAIIIVPIVWVMIILIFDRDKRCNDGEH